MFAVPTSAVPWEGCLVCGFVSGSFSVVCYGEEVPLQGCAPMWRVCPVGVLGGSLPATSEVSLLIREAGCAAKANTEVVLDAQRVSASLLPASRVVYFLG